MINPFASFLQPPTRQSPLEGAPEFMMALSERKRQQGLDAQRKLENDQQFGLAQRGATRADSQLKLQQDEQSHRFTTEEQKQVEGLLAEYQDAEDQGDQVRLSRASQMLKRFGMDVGQKDPRAQAFTGQKPKPLPGQLLPNVQAFTGEKPQPSFEDDVVKTELASREALKARNGQEAPDLSQEDFESQLINGSTPGPSRYEEGGKTTDEFKGMLPQSPDEPETTGETTKLNSQQEAQFQAWAKSNGIADADDPRAHYDYRGFFLETNGAPHRQGDHFPDTYKQHGHETFSEESRYSKGQGDGGTWNGEQFQPGVIDLDKEDPRPLQVGQLPKVATVEAPQVASAQQSPPRLPGQHLPTIISKGGKQLYESTGPSGRWAPMVSGVFEPFTQHENTEMAAAAKRAQQLAISLVGADGYAPKDAINAGREYLDKEANRISQTERTKIGSRPRFGGLGGTGLMGKTQDIAESAQIYDDNARTEAAKIQEEDRQYESIEAAASSGDPALQRDAVNQLLKIRSGSAVTASEDARISQINGLIAQVQDRLGRWTGGAMTPEMARTIQQIVSLKRQVSQAKIKRIYDHQAKLYQAQNRGKTKDPSVLDERANVIREGANVVGADPNENLYK